MQKIKTICRENSMEFDKEVQAYMDEGYKLQHASSGTIPYCDGTAAYQIFQAILLKEE